MSLRLAVGSLAHVSASFKEDGSASPLRKKGRNTQSVAANRQAPSLENFQARSWTHRGDAGGHVAFSDSNAYTFI